MKLSVIEEDEEIKEELKDFLLSVSSGGSNFTLQGFPKLDTFDSVTELIEERKGECGCEATCLIVDDNLFNLIPLEVLLDKIAGIKVLKAKNGLEAVKLYQRDRFKTCCDKFIKLVLMDLNMPVMGGYEATTEILKLAAKFKAGLDARAPTPVAATRQ